MNATRFLATRFLPPPLTSQLPSLRRFANFAIPFSSRAPAEIFNPLEESCLRALLCTCGRQGNISFGASLHASIVKNPPFVDFRNPSENRNILVTYNCLLHAYGKYGELCDAVKLFEDMPLKDTVSWNSLISVFLKHGNFELGFGFFRAMIGSGVYWFDHASLTSVLRACDGSGIESLGIVKMMHALVISCGYEKEISVGNALMTSYFRCLASDQGVRVFNEMEERNVITWTAMISGLAQNEFYGESLKLFANMYNSAVFPNHLTYLSTLVACSGLQTHKEGAQIHGVVWKLGIQSDICIQSALMDMYSKCSRVEEAWLIFESCEIFDEVSVTVMLTGFAQNGCEEEAIRIFVKMVNVGSKLDPNMVSAILGVCGIDTSWGLGVQVHTLVIKKGFTSNIFVSNGLINMYAKCAELEESVKVFDCMPQKNQVSWNSMIAASARHGNGLKALHFYEEMNSKGVEPTHVTFLSLLHACSHAGLVQKGMEFLKSMETSYGLHPRLDHYACIIDMLGRAGLVKEAKNFIEMLPVKPDVLVWQALLGACSIYGDIDTGKYAADQLAEAAPDSPTPYVSMANIYSSNGRWKERERTIKNMKERGIAKEMGISWIEIEKQIQSFAVADTLGDDVCNLLFKLFRHIRDEGISGSIVIDM
ncbi:pentatricopeptide repeat-containing protein At3g05340-like [Primulina huaijiensis]|uniref:pentatricopeptide repeat-containing protein At3g05340-like n=1 Tax=Primulina huaijiensis TaxID=1492673 RepID=UPI003CC79C46